LAYIRKSLNATAGNNNWLDHPFERSHQKSDEVQTPPETAGFCRAASPWMAGAVSRLLRLFPGRVPFGRVNKAKNPLAICRKMYYGLAHER